MRLYWSLQVLLVLVAKGLDTGNYSTAGLYSSLLNTLGFPSLFKLIAGGIFASTMLLYCRTFYLYGHKMSTLLPMFKQEI